MMLRTIKSLFVVFALVFFVQSCEDRLDLQPEDERLTADSAFDDPAAYKQFLAKIYAGISLSGQQGPAGSPDLAGLDEGFSNYLRLYWKMQELTTDEAIIGWNDGTIQDLHGQVWAGQSSVQLGSTRRVQRKLILLDSLQPGVCGWQLRHDVHSTYRAAAGAHASRRGRGVRQSPAQCDLQSTC